MLKNTLFSFSLAFQNIRTNLFHTALSVLGIVIGVAALVSILCLIDGLEKFAKDEITRTTSLNAILVNTRTHRAVGDISVKKDTFAVMDFEAYQQLTAGLEHLAMSALFLKGPAEMRLDTSSKPLGGIILASTPNPMSDTTLVAGRVLNKADLQEKRLVVVVNAALAKQALGNERYPDILQKPLHLKDRTLMVVGVVKSPGAGARAQANVPISLLDADELKKNPPTLVLEAGSVEFVNAVKTQVEERLARQFPGRKADFEVVTNDYRVGQAAKGIMLFRIIMGLIVGISIIVGGIGVMNVLLISVTERTVEIGIRKALGAKRLDILRQFLAESITISAFGSMLGLVVGVLATMVIIPIIKALTELPFEAVYTWNTFFTIGIIAILVGIIFGTYPAMKASKLDPVEAIRRE
ncbi:MAG: ABC transporter permease [Saprospirales bacterium]|nr:ABC transporter permease [Saprospirales bacterium]